MTAIVKIKTSPLLIRSLSESAIMAKKRKQKIAFTAGLGAGKTHALIQRHHQLCCLNIGCNFSVFFLPIYEKIFSSTIPTYKKVLASYGYIEGTHYKIVKSPFPKLIYWTGHEVHFHSANRPEMIQAVEYSHASMDETGSCSKDAALAMDDRVRDNKALYLQSSYAGVPIGLNFYSEMFNSDLNEGWLKIANNYHHNPELRAFRFKMSTFENPYIPADYVKGLEINYKHNPSLLRAYLYGEFTPNLQGLASPLYNPAVHDVDYQEATPFRDINFCWDFNRAPLAWVVIQRLPVEDYTTRRFPFFAIASSSGHTTQLRDACIEFSLKFPVEKFGNTVINLYGDRSGHAGTHKLAIDKSDYESIKETLLELGYKNIEIKAHRGVVPQAESIDAVNRLFYNNLLFISLRDCKKLKESLIKTELKEGTREILKPSGDTWTHWYDSLKYFCWQEAFHSTDSDSKIIKGMFL